MDAEPMGTPQAVIATQGLTKHYGKVEALVDLTLDVQPGEIFGFLGPNGAGKSTLIRTLLGFLHPTRGSATVLGLDIVADSVEIRRRTGYLPGGIALYDSLSGADALEYLADLQDRGSTMRQELCERLQMPASVLRRKVRDYSRGMRQKIGVIQALQHDPELAILDEPTEGLDPLMQHAFYALMDDQRAKGRSTFFSSHVLSEVERICDRVAIIRSGQLMALQNVDDLLARRKKKVELRWRGVAPDLTGIPGLADVEVKGDRMRATLQGDVSGFVRAIASPSLEDLTIEPARLEEAFLEYYAGDEASEEMRG
ncbi:MAG TPA: ABC transporter ATP-binding protein [Candidatus Limnocylindria bacterium]|jgi:ABC-2 type transport system ATP-binding protein|nr:ABC transporter ATP-binding protein [Candidatus Limnocylindria bacterium]